MSVIPTKFENRDGFALYGMLHTPDGGPTRKPAIILLSPGVKMRVAPHRLYVNMTKQFLQLGFMVFRFDFYALGDSAGSLNEHWLADVYNSVALGRYINDSIDAMNWLQNEYGTSEFVMAGLCGGALTGLLVAKDDSRVIGLLGLGMPVVLESSESDRVKNLTKGQLSQYKSGYLRKLSSAKSWFRVLTLQSDFKVIFRAFSQILKTKIKHSKNVVSATEDDKQSNVDESNINPLFGPAFFSMLESSRHMLLIFSGADRLFWEFEEKFTEPNNSKLGKYDEFYEVHTVEDANHIFSNKIWQQDMLQTSKSWLSKHF